MYGLFTCIWVVVGVNVGINIPYIEHLEIWDAAKTEDGSMYSERAGGGL